MTPLLIRRAELDGRRTDVLIDGGQIVAVSAGLEPPTSCSIIDADGGALLPGLHDHHLHLLAMAARASSVHLGPPTVRTPADLDRVLRDAHRTATNGAWLRGVEHDDDTGGPVDRDRLDALAPGRRVRVQHRSGALWTLSSAALALLPLTDAPEGVELDHRGRPTGRLWRLDGWLRAHLPPREPPDLVPIGRLLASRGVTGVTDATPSTDRSDHDVLAEAVAAGRLPLRVTVMGGPALSESPVRQPLRLGPVKIIIGDHEPPDLVTLVEDIRRAHAARRAVAIHCVTSVATALALAAWDEAGAADGDRMEHGSLVGLAAAEQLARSRITVVTQPAFIYDHGDRYLRDVDPGAQSDLYRCASLIEAGVPVGGSSDAPFGDADPWRAIASATERRTGSGRPIGTDEALPARRALDLYLTSPDAPGGSTRTVEVGAPADLCLLAQPLAAVLPDPAAAEVTHTIVDGRQTHGMEH